MPFTGNATYSAGGSLPEMAEDVRDVIGIVSPYETPLLDHLGDPQRAAPPGPFTRGSKTRSAPTSASSTTRASTRPPPPPASAPATTTSSASAT